MFSECSSLKELNISNFNTSNVTNMRNMFFKCKSLKVLNLSNFTANKVTNMTNMFGECVKLKELKLPNFNPKNINVSNMFYACSNELMNNIKTRIKNLLNLDNYKLNKNDNL